jgi:hypothetical protein
MFVIDSYGRHRRLSAKEIEANQESIALIKVSGIASMMKHVCERRKQYAV